MISDWSTCSIHLALTNVTVRCDVATRARTLRSIARETSAPSTTCVAAPCCGGDDATCAKPLCLGVCVFMHVCVFMCVFMFVSALSWHVGVLCTRCLGVLWVSDVCITTSCGWTIASLYRDTMPTKGVPVVHYHPAAFADAALVHTHDMLGYARAQNNPQHKALWLSELRGFRTRATTKVRWR